MRSGRRPNGKPVCLLDQNSLKSARTVAHDARDWSRILGRYRGPDDRRALLELLITAVPFAALSAAAWAALGRGHWAGLLLAIPAAAFLLRLFLIQHDCGHGAFFSRKAANDWTGRILGVLTLTPYAWWQRAHAIHHATSGSLDRRGVGDIDTLTVAEYRARSAWGRARYRMYRHPLVLLGIGPAYMFLLQHRLPVGMMRRGWRPWASALGTNLGIAVAVAAVSSVTGLGVFLLVQLPVALLAATAGIWLFFVQHQFEQTAWDRHPDWTWQDAALHGSSHYDLPAGVRWFTANIGLHHVHHLCSHIPFYRLSRVLRDHPELGEINRLTLLESFRCIRLTLWDEAARRMISFREAGLAA